MDMGMTAITGKIVEYALDGLSLRHSAIAANIANANSTGYRPLRVSFESNLSGLLGQSTGSPPFGPTPSELPTPQVFAAPPISESLRHRALENEIVQLNRNVLQYQALIKGLDKYTAVISTAINEGRR
mgnify:FL=1